MASEQKQTSPTPLFIPAWIVDGFCNQSAHISPTLVEQELKSLALVNHLLQRQLLSTDSFLEDLSLTSESTTSLKGICSISDEIEEKNLAADVLRSIDLLGGLRIDSTNNEERRLIMDQERRSGRLLKDTDWKISWKCEASSQDLILGVRDPVLRAASNASNLKKPLDRSIPLLQPPLKIWAPLLRNLEMSEWNIHLRLEQALQGHFSASRPLFLGHRTAMIPIDQLFIALNLRPSSNNQALSTLLRQLQKLGANLRDSGWLDSFPESMLDLAAPNKRGKTKKNSGTRLNLAWRISDDCANPATVEVYKSEVTSFFSKRILSFLTKTATNQTSWLNQQFRPDNEGKELFAGAMTLLEEQNSRPLLSSSIDIGSAELMPIFFLYWEWRLRFQLKAEPLPEALQIQAERFFTGPVNEMAEKFSSWISAPDQVDVRKHLRSITSPGWSHFALGGMPSVSVQICNPEQTLKQKLDQTLEKTMPTPAVTTTTSSSMSATSTARMKKIAAEELLKLRERQPVQYKELRSNYFNSLDQSAKRIIAEVQKRMEPRMFEEHLHPRLVKYMVENPGAWRTDGPQGAAPKGPSSPFSTNKIP